MKPYIASEPAIDGISARGGTAIAWLAILAGFSVANLYSGQALLGPIAHHLSLTPAWSGGLVAVTQLGYALGLVTLVPLGDRWPRRLLLSGGMAGTAAALMLAAASPNGHVLAAALTLVGLLAVGIQISVSFAADLVSPVRTGQAIGAVTAGVALGVILARVLPGPLAAGLGWRAVYALCGVLAIGLAVGLWRSLPSEHRPPPGRVSGPGLLDLLVGHVDLRRRGLGTALNFAMLGALWSALPFAIDDASAMVASPLWRVIGAVGVSGVCAAAWAGRQADRSRGNVLLVGAAAATCAAWLLLTRQATSAALTFAGASLLDGAVQAAHVTNQSAVLRTAAGNRGRLVAAYMLFYAAGTAVGSITATWLYAHGGWSAVCALGLALGLGSLVHALWLSRHGTTPTPA